MNIQIEEVTEWPRCNAVKGLLIYKENEKPCTKQKMWNTNLNSEKIFLNISQQLLYSTNGQIAKVTMSWITWMSFNSV